MPHLSVTGDSLVLVHLSDIHFRHRGAGYAEILDRDLRDELRRDVVMLARQLGPVTGILVTGDIAFAGKSEEYEVALSWLDELTVSLGCERENVWVIPGNHDVDRAVFEASTAIQDMHALLRSQNPEQVDRALERYLRDPAAAHALLSPLAQYNVFARRYGCDTTPEKLHWEQPIRLNDGSELRIRGVNSALVCDPHDDEAPNQLILGTRQCVLPRAQPDADPIEYLYLCHHPPQFLIDQDAVLDYLRRARILLFGHKHRQRTEPVGDSLRVFAGAVHPSREESGWTPTYNVLSIRVEPDPRRLQVLLWPRVWNAERTQFGRGPTEGDEPYDQYTFKLPPRPMLPTSVEVIEGPAENPEKSGPIPEMPQTSSRPATGGLSRHDVFRFFSLPFQVRLQIALDLGLLEADDERLEEPERFRRVLLRVTERGMTDKFIARLNWPDAS